MKRNTLLCLIIIIILLTTSCAQIDFTNTDQSAVLSDDKNEIIVPNVINKTYEEAEALLDEYGLYVGNIALIKADDKYNGVICFQDPQSGEKVEKGSRIDVRIYKD